MPQDSDCVVLLGTKGGPAIRPGSSMPTSSLLRIGGMDIVVDCGLGVTRALVDQGVKLTDLRLIFITHLHSDHYLELGPLLHTAWTAGLKSRVDVWGPAGLEAYWTGFIASMAADIDLRIEDEGRPDLRALIVLHEIRPEQAMTVGPVQVQAIRTLHPPLVDCFALRFESNGKAVVFSADTAPFPEMADFAQGADLLIHEAMLTEALAALVARVGNGDDRLMRHLLRSHTPAEAAADLATRSGVKALALNHLIPSDDPAYGEADWQRAVSGHWSGPFHLGADGLVIPF